MIQLLNNANINRDRAGWALNQPRTSKDGGVGTTYTSRYHATYLAAIQDAHQQGLVNDSIDFDSYTDAVTAAYNTTSAYKPVADSQPVTLLPGLQIKHAYAGGADAQIEGVDLVAARADRQGNYGNGGSTTTFYRSTTEAIQKALKKLPPQGTVCPIGYLKQLHKAKSEILTNLGA